jgi:uncharacterized protein (DUF2236 family)
MTTVERGTIQRYAGDIRLLNNAGWALLMQVSHPTVGAGVEEHSNYREDPWGRLIRTLDFVNLLVYGTPEQSAAVGANVRAMHKRIKGVRPDGERYHALEPEAFAWVHATLIEAIILSYRRFVGRISPPTAGRMYSEWRELGAHLGVRERDLPETYNEFRIYFDTMVEDRLEDNETVQGVLESLSRPVPPPLPQLAQTAFSAISRLLVRSQSVALVGTLPPVLRERFGLEWTRAKNAELAAAGAASRALGPALPKSLRNFGPTYLEWRAEDIERSGIGRPPAQRRMPTAA